VRILYLCHRIPWPPDKGDKIRAFHQLRAIAERHEVDVFTLADDPADLQHQPALLPYCHRLTVVPLDRGWARMRSLPFLLTGKPLTVPYFYSAELQRKVREAVGQRSYDRVFVYCSAMSQYVDGLGIPVVTDFVDVDSNKWTQYAEYARWPFSAVYSREGRALREYERRVSGLSSYVIVTTEREARLLRQISDSARVHVIPNGVDCEHFQPPGAAPDSAAPAVGFVGDMSYFPNQEAVKYFARIVFPLICQQLPGTRFLIVGRKPSPDVLKLGRIAGVEVTGFVPDVRPWLAQMRVSVAPFSIAAGIQNKILEAMAFGLPVVATSRAAQGLSGDTAGAVEIADSPGEMSEKIVGLLSDRDLARNRGLEGRRRVAVEYSWTHSLDRLLQLLESPAGEMSRAAAPSSLVS
jgi:sugar transferase (PEP-CTERM/EpsH1 system associated)